MPRRFSHPGRVALVMLVFAAAATAAAAQSSRVLAPAPGAAAPAGARRPAPDSAAIEGVVLDAATRHPLAGVVVRVVGLNRQEITHANGDFHFTELPHGRHTVLVERLGYRREVRQVELARGQTLRLMIELQISAIELPGLVVTGTVGERLGSDAVRPVDVVAGQELARKLELSVAATLQHEPGLASTSMGPATARPVIRGLGGDRVLILEDGARPGDLSSASADHALSVDPLNAQRMEVVRGPAALIYGSNALGGVVNIIRDEVPGRIPDRPTGSVTLQGESVNDGLSAGGVGTLALGTVALRGEASVRDAGSTRTPRGLLDNTQLRTYNLAAGAGTGGGWGNAGVSFRYFDNAYGVPPEPEEEGEAEEEEGHDHEHVTIDMRRYAVHGKAELHNHVGPWSHFTINTTYTDYFHQELEGNGEVGTQYALKAGALDVVGRHDALGFLSSGAIGGRVELQDYAAGGSTQTPASRELSLAGFALEELALGDLRLQAGARYDLRRVEPDEANYDAAIGAIRTRTFGAVSASLGALYQLTPALHAGLAVARAFRTPGTSELFSQGPHLASFSYEVGNPDLEAETGLGVDAFLRLHGARLSGEVAAFRNAIDNYIYYRNTGHASPLGMPLYQATGSDAVLAGFEASAEWLALRNVVIDGVLSYVRGDYESAEGTRPLPMIPPLHGQLNVRYERPGYFVGLGWEAAAEQDRVEAPETPTGGYGILNATAGYRFQLWHRVHSLTLRADNLTDALYYQHLSRTKDLFPEPGRDISLVYRVIF